MERAGGKYGKKVYLQSTLWEKTLFDEHPGTRIS